jgi:uncharacterized protein (DUF2252 family)
MAASPFACFRGSVGIMAFDLAPVPVSGLNVQLTGDAHLLNLGAYAAPDGHLVFDLNDFDQACHGPFEWDLKRLAVSAVLGGREAGQRNGACRDAALGLVESYRTSLERFAEMRVLELARYEITPGSTQRGLAPVFEKAARDTSKRLIKKATEPDGDRVRFRNEPPILRPATEAEAQLLVAAFAEYRESLGAGRQQVLDAYRPYDFGFRVAGVGSVGVDSYLVLCYGHDASDPLFLQIKQVTECVWQRFVKDTTEVSHNGRRAAEAQARTQTVSDPFLGWTRVGTKDCLVRQWSDHKASIAIDMLRGRALLEYAELCGEVLAKAHARTGDAAMLAGYCGAGDNLDQAVANFAMAYADQAEADYARLTKAISVGELEAVVLG